MLYAYAGIGVILGVVTFIVARQAYIYRAMSSEIPTVTYIMVTLVGILYVLGGIFLIF